MAEIAKNGRPTETVNKPTSHKTGEPLVGATQPSAMATGSAANTNSNTAPCTNICRRSPSNRVVRWAYKYPASSVAWKKTTDVFQTAADPPKDGSTNFVNMGCTENRRNALRKSVAA